MRFSFAILVIGLVTIVASCGDGSMQQTSGSAQVRVLQGSPDLGSVEVSADGKVLTTNLAWRRVYPMPYTSYAAYQQVPCSFKRPRADPALQPSLQRILNSPPTPTSPL